MINVTHLHVLYNKVMNPIQQKVHDFFETYKIAALKKGHVLARPGTDPDGVWYLVTGQIRQYDIAPNGDEIVLNTFKPGAFLPMSWAINKTPNRYFFDATIESAIKKAPADEVVAFLHKNPDVLFDLLSRVYRGTDGLLGRMSFLMQNSARNRIIYELIISIERFGTKQNNRCALGMNETDLASRVGLTRETTNREMRKLKQEGVVQVAPDGIQVTDVTGLKAKLEL